MLQCGKKKLCCLHSPHNRSSRNRSLPKHSLESRFAPNHSAGKVSVMKGMSASSIGWVMEDKKAESTLIEAIQQLHGLNRQFKNIFSDQLKPSQLTDSEFLVMWWCYQSEGEPIVQGELAVQIGLSPAQLSGIVDRLNKRSLLHLTRKAHVLL